MFYKNDWEKAKKRIEAFWVENEIIDRCCIGVFAPRKNSKLPPFPELQWGPWLGGLDRIRDDDEQSIKNWWVDPEQNYQRMITWFENTYFGGEAIPCTYVNWGAMAMAAFFGSSPVFKKTSVWYPEVIHNWDEWEWKFDQSTNECWQQTINIVEYFLANNNQRYFVGTPEFGTAGDLLSLMRGMDNLAIDLYETPDVITNAINILANKWIDLHEEIYLKTKKSNFDGGVLAWMSLWAPGRISQLACDFSTIISPTMFKKFFVPEIKKEASWCEYSTYHLDGPQAMKNHLDTILSVDSIQAVEWTPGAANSPTYSPQYIPQYRKIQEAGKRLYLLAKAEEIEPILSELSPKGLYLCTQTNSEDEANELLKKAEKWSVINKEVKKR